MSKYLLRGTISVRVEAGTPTTTSPNIMLDVTPAVGFLTPESIGYKHAIAFAEDDSGSIPSVTLIPLTNESMVRCTVDDSIEHLLAPVLVRAAQIKPVMLHIESGDPPKVVGFQCP